MQAQEKVKKFQKDLFEDSHSDKSHASTIFDMEVSFPENQSTPKHQIQGTKRDNSMQSSTDMENKKKSKKKRKRNSSTSSEEPSKKEQGTLNPKGNKEREQSVHVEQADLTLWEDEEEANLDDLVENEKLEETMDTEKTIKGWPNYSIYSLKDC